MMNVPQATARIERPLAEREVLLHRHPYDRVPIGARLAVASDECAVITSHGRVLGTLGPGTHRLVPEQVPFLEAAVDLVGGGQELLCEIYLLLTGTFTGVAVAGSLGKLRDDAGDEIPIWVTASLAVRLADPERLVGALAARREDPIQAVVFHAVRGLRSTLEHLVGRGEVVARTVARDATKVKRAGEASELGLTEIGLDLVGIETLELAREPPAAAARPAAGSPGTGPDPGLLPPGSAEVGWVIPAVPHVDMGTGLRVGVTFHGSLVGTPVRPELMQWVVNAIGEALCAMGSDYSGHVLDIPSHAAELSALLTERVAPRLGAAGIQGQVSVTGFELPPQDPVVAELYRRYPGPR
ncbi:MAG: SPFH domain-containing protein [Polyangiaceae bacterium]|nr:SPFH domain-containing protein [Polyangiaceae bacterium]